MFNFEQEELEGIAPHSKQEQYLKKFGFIPPPLPEGYSHHVPAPTTTNASRITPPPSPPNGAAATSASSQTGFGANATHGANRSGGEVINKLVAKRGNKKRIQPNFVGSIPSAGGAAAAGHKKLIASGPSNMNSALASRSFDGGPSSSHTFAQPPLPPLSQSISRHVSNSISPVTDNWPHNTTYDADVDMDVPIDSLSTGGAKGKRKASTFDDDAKLTKPRTLGGDRPRESVVVREIVGGGVGGDGVWGNVHAAASTLPVPPLYNSLSVKVEGSDDILDGRNSEDDGA